MSNTAQPSPKEPTLVRGLTLLPAVALNVANMVGIGPFITIPDFIKAMGGPHALVGWVVAAVLVVCDGLVWSELGAALPGSGGTYHFLREIFGRYRWGRLLPFLFIWQFLVSGTLEMASGYIGAMNYVGYILEDPSEPALEASSAPDGDVVAPTGSTTNGSAAPPRRQILHFDRTHTFAAACCLIVTLALCCRVRIAGWAGVGLCAGTIATVAVVIVSGLMHFDASLLRVPPDAFRLDPAFAVGLGGAMLIAIYDYLGYYNICHLGDEVVDPGRTIPRAVLISVVLVAAIYLTMNLCMIAVVPWQKAMESKNIAAEFMERLYGRDVAVWFTWLILWTVAACMFAITLGYSRIPYAAARAGDFFSVFAYVHPRGQYPLVSLLAIGGLTALFCFASLEDVIKGAVTVRILVQFVGQIVALHVLRTTRTDVHLPFRMWLYPAPSIVALVGWFFVLGTSGVKFLLLGLGVMASGCIAFLVWNWRRSDRNAAGTAS
jgi:amino acid transporter